MGVIIRARRSGRGVERQPARRTGQVESEVETAEQLFTKIRDDFRETLEEERKIEQLRTIEQGGRTCDEYVQEFKKVARGSGYEGRPLIEEFKRGLNGSIRRK